nr:hypothetical protein [Chlamydiota bacterium]
CLASSALFGMAIEEADFLFTYDRKSKTISFADGSFNLFYDQQSYPLSFEKLRFSPGNWELEAQDLHGSIVQGQIAIDGLVQASGFWDDNHIKLDHIAWGDWLGDLEIEGSLLHHFQVSNKQSELFVSGDWKNRQFLVERVALDLATILPHSMDQWKPTGLFEGSGQIYYDGELQGEIIATFRDLHFGGISFGDGEHLLCQLNQTSGVSIEGLEAQVGGSSYKLGGFHYNYREEKLHFDGFDFTIPAHRLESVVDVASELFPGKIHGSIRRHLVALKDDEEFAGRVNIELFPNTVWIQLSLNDGCYTLFDQQVDLRSFTLSYDPLELLIKTEARYQDSYYWLRFLTQTPTLNEGVLAIYEHEDEELCIYWDPGWEVCKIEGEAAGCCANLAATNSQERLDLEGSLAIESDRIVPLLSGRLHQMLQNISIEGGYELDGQWYFSKEDPFNPEFYGTIEGRNFGVYNVACNSFCSDLTYCNDQLTMHDFKVIDWSGTLSVRELLLNRAGDFSVEEVKVENFRLSRLNSPWTDMEKRERPLFRSFCVPQFILTNLQGQIKDPASYTGEGSLYFTNYAKKTLFSNLMQLPTEISARLGLDLTNLIPVRGQLIYTIEDGLVKVTEMRDVYSEGKRARFFLADDEPAYLDFEGNIDVKIRMKQYTLLMKIAELFTFSVKGTIFNPLYTVTNHD